MGKFYFHVFETTLFSIIIIVIVIIIIIIIIYSLR